MKNVGSRHTRQRREVLTKAVLRAAGILGLNWTRLAKVLGISPASASRVVAGEYMLCENTQEWERASRFVRLYCGLDALMASDETAVRVWMRNLNRHLNAVPAEKIVTVMGLVDTLEYIDASRARV